MKKFRNLIIALVLVGAMAIPTLAASSGISANSVEAENLVKESVLLTLSDNPDWKNVTVDQFDLVVENYVEPTGEEEARRAAYDFGLNSVASVQAYSFAVTEDGHKAQITKYENGGMVVEARLDDKFVIEPVQPGYTRTYYVVRFHYVPGKFDPEVTRLSCTFDEETRMIRFTSDKFSEFVFGYTDTKIEPVQPQQPQQPEQPAAQPEVVVKPAPVYDDGGPFTHDECGNVYDRWGNEIWHAPVCAANASNGGYSLVNTADR